ncbi:MOSC domain-containing protein [bacterium]|nr:MOSC domain-containing protein [bacterium]
MAVCTSSRRGVAKTAVAGALLVADSGIEGDAHAGPGERQVSLLAGESIDVMRARSGMTLEPGAFGENLVTRGIDLTALQPGDCLAAGEALLRITRIGKECHSRCAIYYSAGDCIMPREGVFAAVLRGGRVKPGDSLTRVVSAE